MAVKLHRCPNIWVKLSGHPCWRVQKQLDAAGIDYEVVKEPLRRNKRPETVEKTGQNKYPWIEFEDGTVLREESKDLAARIKAGRLFEGRVGGVASATAAPPSA
jgi:glutathione S-transferase-like protein